MGIKGRLQTLMTDTWILRWDTNHEETPKAILTDNGGRYSYTTFGEDHKSFVLFDGYLFDKEIYKLPPEATDAECVASAYREYKTDLFDKLRGGFTLAIWDHAIRRLVAGRDAMGLNPFYYYWNGSLFLMSSNMDELLFQPEIDTTFNQVRIAEYIQNIWNSHQRIETFYQEIIRLPSAHYLTLQSRVINTLRYWDPIPPGFDWATEEEQSKFETILERAVSRCLSVGADSIALSGGYDSVSIAILAQEQLNGKKPLHALSLRFIGTNTDEGDTQMAVAQALGMPQTIKSTKEALDGKSFVEASLELSKSSPCPVIGLWQAMYSFLLKSAKEYDLHTIMLGTGGDEMLIVDLAYGADLLAKFDLTGLWRFYQAMVRTSPFPAQRVARVVFWDSGVKPEIMSLANTTIEAISPTLRIKMRDRRNLNQPWAANPDLQENLKLRAATAKPVEIAPGERRYIRKIRDLPQSPMLMFELEQGAN